MHLSGLFLYPVKSLRGCAITAAEMDELGLVGDRRFMVVDSSGRFLSQRSLPRMALIATALSPTSLTLSANGKGTIVVARTGDPDTPRRTVSIWKSEGLVAEDCGDPVAAWLGDVLGVECRLVRAGRDFHRDVRTPTAEAGVGPAPQVGFADAYPFLILSEASLADLNDRLQEKGEEPVPLDRFRPNLVVTGCRAGAEDAWPRFRIGDAVFRSAGPCARCVVTTTDQFNATREPEPLRTLSGYRRDHAEPEKVNFGQNLIHETFGTTLRIGDPVVLL